MSRLGKLGLAIAWWALAQSAVAGAIYQWTDAAGERHFTTDLAQIPASQRDAALARARAESAAQPPAAQSRASAERATAAGQRVVGVQQSHLSAEAFAVWRRKLLTTSRPIDASHAKGGVWAVLMETGYENGSGTLLVRADGSAEMLLSVGGGVIGGGDIPAINALARSMVTLASRELKKLPPVAVTPPPSLGEVRLYALTENGVHGAMALHDALASREHPLSALFLAGHEVITGLREASAAASSHR